MTRNDYTQFNNTVINAIKQDKAFFMNPDDSVLPIIRDSLSGNPIGGANYFNLICANDLHNTRHTEYIPMNEVLSSKPDWLSALAREKRPMGLLYREDGQLSEPRFSFLMPAAELNQTVHRDSPVNTITREHYIPYQSHSAGIHDFNGFLYEQCTNAVNASYTGHAFRSTIPVQDYRRFKTTLINTINSNPRYMADIADRAHQEVMDFHYLPYNRKSFIDRARNENSNEFKQLGSFLSGHIEEIYSSGKPSYNREFNELSKPLITVIENLRKGNAPVKTAVDIVITDFLQKQIKQEKSAAILADTYAGSYCEKMHKAARIGKIVFTGAALAGALFTSNYPAAAGIAGALINDISVRYKAHNDVHDRNKVVIKNHVFRGSELMKILDFDKAPFSLTGNAAITARDYEIAHRAERTILGMHPKINKDEYQQNITRQHKIDFCKNISSARGALSENDIMKVIDTIMTVQEMRGNSSLKSCRTNPRSFYACLNKTVRDNPQVLREALSQLDSHKNRRVHSAARTRI